MNGLVTRVRQYRPRSSVVLGVGVAIILIVGGLSVSGSIAFGVGWFAFGVMFSAVAALAGQLTESRRVAIGISSIVLAAMYLLRALGEPIGLRRRHGAELAINTKLLRGVHRPVRIVE